MHNIKRRGTIKDQKEQKDKKFSTMKNIKQEFFHKN